MGQRGGAGGCRPFPFLGYKPRLGSYLSSSAERTLSQVTSYTWHATSCTLLLSSYTAQSASHRSFLSRIKRDNALPLKNNAGMNKLATKRRSQVVAALVEGASIRGPPVA